jgi:hypothetical protein
MQITATMRGLAQQIEHSAAASSGALDAALAAGRLPGTRSAAELDRLEHLVSTGTAIDATRRSIGTNGANGFRTAVNLHTVDGGAIDVVEKSTAHEGAQEQFGWLVARALGIDHRVALVARAADGTARIEHLPDTHGWTTLFEAGVRDVASLDQALANCIRRESPHLTEPEVTRTARIERQLLQVFDYVIANDDRNLGNARARLSDPALKFIDHGNAGTGQHGRDDVLVPGLRSALQGTGGTTKLDADVVGYLRRRVTTDALRSAHDRAFDPKLLQGTQSRATGNAASASFRDGTVARFQHALGGEFHYGSPGSSLAPPLQAVDERPMRGGMAQARFGAHGVGGFGGMS